MAVGKVDIFEQVFSNAGNPGAGYKVRTSQGGTSTPLATYTDATGLIPNANPIVADSAGRYQCWITLGVAYKFELLTDLDVVLYTVDNYSQPDVDAEIAEGGGTSYSLIFFRPGGEMTNTELVFGAKFEAAVTFPANWSGSQAKVPKTLPTGNTILTFKKNAVTCGTCTYNTAGAATFASTGGAAVEFAIGDELDVYGPATADATIADWGLTLLGEVDA
jgi:hypothetical protein